MADKGDIPDKTSTTDDQEREAIPSVADYICPICLQLLIEPVVMPCTHELCIWCFRQNVQEANLQCPLCRIRISSWTRRQERNGTLVNLKRWEEIKRLFPEKCQKRLRGEDFDDEDEVLPQPKRTISVSGEVRKEYEEEVKKIRQVQEEEIRRSEETIEKLLQEERELQQALDCQQKQDELLAKELYQIDKKKDQDFRSSTQSNRVSPNGFSQKGKKSGSTKPKLVTLDKWFSTKNNKTGVNDEGANEKPSTIDNCVKNIRATHSQFVTADNSKPTRNVNYELFDPGYSEWLKQKQLQEEQDFLLAQKLQNEFDDDQKKKHREKESAEGYLLRNLTQSASAR